MINNIYTSIRKYLRLNRVNSVELQYWTIPNQASDKLLEGVTTTGEVNLLNNQLERPRLSFIVDIQDIV
jgi:hypothetical protein